MTSTAGNGRREAARPGDPRGDQARPRRRRRADGDVDRALRALPGDPGDARLLDGGVRRRGRDRRAVDPHPHAPELDDARAEDDLGRFPLAGWQRRATSTARTTRTPAGSTFPTSRRSRRSSSTARRSRSPARSATTSTSAGEAPASYGADATEIYQEGFRIPPCRIVTAGEPNELFLPLFESNIRVPLKTVSDLRAQIAALSIGAAR